MRRRGKNLLYDIKTYRECRPLPCKRCLQPGFCLTTMSKNFDIMTRNEDDHRNQDPNFSHERNCILPIFCNFIRIYGIKRKVILIYFRRPS